MTEPLIKARIYAARFRRSDKASSLPIFALLLPVIASAVGISIDYSRAVLLKTQMQAVADSAALMAARQLQLATSTSDKVSAFATSYVGDKLPNVATATAIDTKALTVKLTLTANVDRFFTIGQFQSAMPVKAEATAQLSSGLPLCLVGLDGRADATLSLQTDSYLSALGCLVYSNSKSTSGIVAKDNAVMKAGFICSAGGKSAAANSSFAPQPATDCPSMPDPLAGRPLPPDSGCNYLLKVVAGVSETLQPGVYCGGLTISLGANVRMAPGVYVIKDGPFLVNGNSTLTGDNVGIYLKGLDSNLKFDTATTISLTAPKSGPMVGMLIIDDPTGAPALLTTLVDPLIAGKYTKLLSPAREHLILSDNARTLIGTIYMPKGRLIIDATKPVADRSAYTVLVLDQLDLYSGPNLVLNSDYGASEIPVPPGVGIYGAKVSITK